MKIEIKKSIKPIDYNFALSELEKRLSNIINSKSNELIWILEHNEIYTAGTSSKNEEILNKDIKVINTNRGGKITYHGPGQLMFYFVIDLNRRKKDIRKFISIIENTIIETLNEYEISVFADKENVGIWFNQNNEISKVAAIGVRVSKWIAYHGFSLNINCDLKNYNNIIPCGISDRGVTNLVRIKDINYKGIEEKLIKNFITNLEILSA